MKRSKAPSFSPFLLLQDFCARSALAGLAITALMLTACANKPASSEPPEKTPAGTAGAYSNDEVGDVMGDFFGATSQNMAQVIDRLFSDYGEPNAYIAGEDIGGALIAGATYGKGVLHIKNGESHEIYWQGPSVGWDFGVSGTKVFMLIYNLDNPEKIYQRFPGVDGRAFVIGGVGVNYLQSEDIIITPMRAGSGLRLGANVGYLKFRKEETINPF